MLRDLDAELERLAKLKILDYERIRNAEAQRLGIKRVSALDEAIRQKRAELAASSKPQGDLDQLVEPWPEPVNGSRLLLMLTDALKSHVILPEHAYVSVALWILHAHAHDAAAISPILAIISPEKRCGKTTLLSLLQELTPNPLLAANITAAAFSGPLKFGSRRSLSTKPTPSLQSERNCAESSIPGITGVLLLSSA